MNSRFPLLAALLITLGLSANGVAQDASKEVKVDIKNVQIQSDNTPDFTVSYAKPKRWKSKEWMSIEVFFQVDKARVPGGDRNPVVDSLEIKYFIGLNKTTKEGKSLMLSGAATYLNAAERTENVAMMFASPSTVFRLLEKNSFTPADIKAWGVEVYYNGAVAGWKSTTNSRWWVDGAANLENMSGLLVPKSKTPFAPLYGDYDLQTSDK